MHNNSVIQLSKKAIQANLSFLQTTFGKNVTISSVIKGNAYGHGIKEFVSVAHECGISHFSAFDAEEAKIVFETLQNKVTIMIMGFIADSDLEWAIINGIEFFVFEKIRLQKAIKVAKKLKSIAKIHIEVETGMNRTGFDKTELNWVLSTMKKEAQFIEFAGLCTHYAGAESFSNYFRVNKQIELYNQIYNQFVAENVIPKIRHTACSAASMMFPETRMDLVRIGIMQYGLWPSPEVLIHFLNSKKKQIDPLKRVISWESEVMSTKKVNSGDFIGYGTSYMAAKKMTIAIIPIGYSHGYSRSLSNHGRVLINGKICTVIGTVNMNMISVDVTDAGVVLKGNVVTLIGTQDKTSITIASFSDFSNQLNYELLTRIAKPIPRQIID